MKTLRVLSCEISGEDLLVAFSDGKTFVFQQAFLSDNRDKHGQLAASDDPVDAESA
jgi:hypothetical protein